MSTTKVIGEVDWEVKPAENKESDFMPPLKKDGDFIEGRIMSNPVRFYVHWTTDASGAKRKITCSNHDCPLCQDGDKNKPSFLVKFLDRATNKIKLYEFGNQIYNQVAVLKTKKSWGSPNTYDISISRGAKGSNPLYTVLPSSKSPLTEEELALLEEFDSRVDINKFIKAPTREEVLEKLGRPAEGIKRVKPAEVSVGNSNVQNQVRPFTSSKRLSAILDDEDVN